MNKDELDQWYAEIYRRNLENVAAAPTPTGEAGPLGRGPKMNEVRCPHGHLAHLNVRDKSNGCLLCGRHDISVKRRAAPHVRPHPLPWDIGYRGEWESA